MKPVLTFTAAGTAVPQGSKTARPVGGGRWGVVDAKKEELAEWRRNVGQEALRAWKGKPLIEGPVLLQLVFVRVRKDGHLLGGGRLSADGRTPRKMLASGMAPDLGKIGRGVEDALTGVVLKDDSLIVWTEYRKLWGRSERVLITVWTLDPGDASVLYRVLPDDEAREQLELVSEAAHRA